MKTQQTVERDLIQYFVAQTTKVTNFVKGSVIRAIFTAVSAVMGEAWNDLNVNKRKMFTDTATGADLDLIASRRGMTRLAATPSAAIVVFNGPPATVIPAGTQVRSSVGSTIYTTAEEITIGAKNAGLSGKAQSIALGDSVFVESTTSGRATRAAATAIDTLVTPITDVTVYNPAPTTGGDDVETDDLFAARIRDEITLLDQATQIFFETMAKKANPAVMRALSRRDPETRGVKITVVKNSGGIFSGGDLSAIATYISTRCRALDTITCVNITYATIEIDATINFLQANQLADITIEAADAVANYLDVRTWPWGKTVQDEILISILNEVEKILNIVVPTFRINGNIGDALVPFNSLPRLSGITLRDATLQQAAVTEATVQSYPNPS